MASAKNTDRSCACRSETSLPTAPACCAAPFARGDRFILSLPRQGREDLLIICDVRHCSAVATGIHAVGVRFLDDGGVCEPHGVR